MNRKGLLGTIGKIIIILILVLIIANFLGINLMNLAKSQLGFIDKLTPVDYTQINNQAKESFSKFGENIEKCKNFQSTDCKCSIDLTQYSETHAILFEKNKIKLFNIKNLKGDIYGKIKNGDGVLIKSLDIPGLNCFFKKGLEDDDFELMLFDIERGPVIFKDAWYSGFLTSKRENYEMHNDYQLYKKPDGSVCWLTESAREDTIQIKICN